MSVPNPPVTANGGATTALASTGARPLTSPASTTSGQYDAVRLAEAKHVEDQQAFYARTELRSKLLTPHLRHRQPGDALDATNPMAKLDSSIKRCTGLIRKLRAISDHSAQSLLAELSAVNLSRYVSEAVSALAESPLRRVDDIDKLVRVAVALNDRHDTVQSALIAAIQKTFGELRAKSAKRSLADIQPPCPSPFYSSPSPSPPSLSDEDEKRRRSHLRLLTEFFYCGFFTDARFIVDVLEDAVQRDVALTHGTNLLDTARSSTLPFGSLSLIVSFTRYGGEEFVGVTARKVKESYAMIRAKPLVGHWVPSDIRQQCHRLFDSYHSAVVARFSALAKDLAKLDRRIAKSRLLKGEANTEMMKERAVLSDNLERLTALVAQLCDALDVPMPAVPTASEDAEEAAMLEVVPLATLGADDSFAPFEDEESKLFYTALVDLALVVPPILLHDDDAEKAKWKREKRDEEASQSQSHSAAENVDTEAGDEREEDEREKLAVLRKRFVTPDDLSVEQLEAMLREVAASKPAAAAAHEDDRESDTRSQALDSLLASLPSCQTRESIDQLASKFAFFNTRANRRRLVNHLMRLPRTALSLLPFAARLVATYSKFHTDISERLASELAEEFYTLLTRKDDAKLDFKIKNLRWIGELVKFGLLTPTDLFNFGKACLLAPSKANFLAVAALLESTGYWLYHSPELHLRTVAFMDQLKKARESGPFSGDNAVQSAVQHALICCCPESQPRKVIAPLHPLERYVRHLVLVQLAPRTVEHALQQLRKLPWSGKRSEDDEPDVPALVLTLLSSPHQVKYSCLNSLASLASGLCYHHPALGPPLVDRVLEEIRVGLELHSFSQQQMRIAFVRYLAALFLYRLCDTQLVLDTAATIIQGTGEESATVSHTNTFRLRLLVTLLDPLVSFVASASLRTRRKFDSLLLCVHQLYLAFESLPFDVELAIKDLYSKIQFQYASVSQSQQLSEIRARQGFGDPTRQIDAFQTASLAGYSAGAHTDEESENEGEDEIDNENERDGYGDGDDDRARRVEQDQELEASHPPHEMSEGEVYEDDDEEDEEDDSDLDSDAEDAASVSAVWDRRRAVKSAEELSFDRELERLMSESAESRKYERTTTAMAPVESIMLAHGISEARKATKPVTPLLINNNSNHHTLTPSTSAVLESDSEHVVFRLLSRSSKGRAAPVVKDLLVPVDSEIAINAVANEQQAREERLDVKRLVLAGLEQQEQREKESEERHRAQQWAAMKRAAPLPSASMSRIDEDDETAEPEPRPVARKPYKHPPSCGGGGGLKIGRDAQSSNSAGQPRIVAIAAQPPPAHLSRPPPAKPVASGAPYIATRSAKSQASRARQGHGPALSLADFSW